MATHTANGGRRVKLYVLTDNGKWDDRGTGRLTCDPDPNTKIFTIRVVAEDSGSLSLSSQLRPMHDAFYRRQHNNIILWNERPLANTPASTTEVALSFADPDACGELWDKIHVADKMMQTPQLPHHLPPHIPLQSNPPSPFPQNNSAPVIATSNISDRQPAHPLPSTLAPSTHNIIIPSSSNVIHHSQLNHPPCPTPTSPGVPPATPASLTARFFSENFDTPSWNHDPVEDIIFQNNSNLASPPASQPSSRLSPSDRNHLGLEQLLLSITQPDRDNLLAIVHYITQGKVMEPANVRQAFIRLVTNSQFIHHVCNHFNQAELKGDVELLSALNILVRAMFRLGLSVTLDILLSEKFLIDIIGCLEYDDQNLPQFSKSLFELKRKTMLAETSKEPLHNNPPLPSVTSPTPSQDGAPSAPTEHQSAQRPQQNQLLTPSPHPNPSQPPTADITEASSQHSAGMENNSASANRIHDITSLSTVNTNSNENDKAIIDAEPTPPRTSPRSSPSKNHGEETASSANIATENDGKPFSLRRHRDYLQRSVMYKSIIPITDPVVTAKIHQNYRVTYIRDVILSRSNDEMVTSSLSNIIIRNNGDIIMYFIAGELALRQVFDRLGNALDHRRKLRLKSIPSHEQQAQVNNVENTEHIQSTRAVAAEATLPDSPSHALQGPKATTNISIDEPRNTSRQEEGEGVTGEREENSEEVVGSSEGTQSRATLAASDAKFTSSGDPSTEKDATQEAIGRKTGIYDGGQYVQKTCKRSQVRTDLLMMLEFLKELCGILRGQQQGIKERFYSLIVCLGIIEAMRALLEDEDATLRALACDILSSVIVHNPADVRARILQNRTSQESSNGQGDGSAVFTQSGPHGSERTTVHAGDSGVTSEFEERPVQEEGVEQISGSPTNAEKVSDERAGERKTVDGSGQEKGEGEKQANSCVKESEKESGCGEEAASEKKSGAEGGEVNGNNVVAEVCQSEQSDEVQTNSTERVQAEVATVVGAEQSVAKRRKKKNKTEQSFPLLETMMKVICEDEESGLVLSMMDMLRMLLDPMNMRTANDKMWFLDVFYQKFVEGLLDRIGVNYQESVGEEKLSSFCELLCFCVANHEYRAKYFFLRCDVGRRVCELLKHKRTHVRLCALRFVRTCVGMREEAYDKHIVKQKLMGMVMELFEENKERDNLTRSAILELISFITREERWMLLREVVERHGTTLEESSRYCGVYADALRKWEELMAKVRREGKERREERKRRTRTRVVRDEMVTMDMEDVVEANTVCRGGVVGEGERGGGGAGEKDGNKKTSEVSPERRDDAIEEGDGGRSGKRRLRMSLSSCDRGGGANERATDGANGGDDGAIVSDDSGGRG